MTTRGSGRAFPVGAHGTPLERLGSPVHRVMTGGEETSRDGRGRVRRGVTPFPLCLCPRKCGAADRSPPGEAPEKG
ncbi:Hypothetical protein SCLAV_1185 [Streptomyces clavuligerus]|uniref:Uncharacterized protein n=1 Tax=Streptomyces clavuligerus TaxID=1901 RepID=E2PYP1_STRCL|nr:Hypothetical protein SCLAV_1185 [Streptomyces clavuligerus]